MRGVEEMRQTRDKYKILVILLFYLYQLDKTNEALLAYVGELRRMRKFLLDAGGSADNDEE